MSEKEEEFPFQQFLEALQESKNLRKGLETIVTAISEKNMQKNRQLAIGLTPLFPHSSKSSGARTRNPSSNAAPSKPPPFYLKLASTQSQSSSKSTSSLSSSNWLPTEAESPTISSSTTSSRPRNARTPGRCVSSVRSLSNEESRLCFLQLRSSPTVQWRLRSLSRSLFFLRLLSLSNRRECNSRSS